MSYGITFVAIRKDELNEYPKAIQKWCNSYCEEKTIFGVECFVAIGYDEHKVAWIEMQDEDFEEGLTQEELNDCGIWTWFQNHLDVVFYYYWM